MTDSTRKKLVYTSLPLAILWAAFSLDLGGDRAVAPPDQYAVAQPAIAAGPSPATTPSPTLIDTERFDRLPWGDDPFRCYLAARSTKRQAGQELAWILGGIIFNADRPMAFVNKKTVTIGDKIDGATVVAIDDQTVTLDYRGRTITLKVNKG